MQSRSLLLIAAFFMAHFEAHGVEACKPSYQVSHEACKPTGRTSGTTQIREAIRVVAGACKPNDQALCNQHPTSEVQKLFPEIQNPEVRLVRAYHQDAFGKFCGEISDLRSKVDVYCEYEVKLPKPELVADESCAVSGVTETNGCYAKEREDVNLDLESINTCLDAKPSSDSELWIKAACLVDAYNAQTQNRLKADLSSTIYDRIEVQLKALKRRKGIPATLSQYIEVETRI